MAWTQVCDQLNSQANIYSMAVFDGVLYGGTNPGGRLFRLNEAGDAWEQVCDQLDSQTHIYTLCEYDSRLYGGTSPGGRLFRLNEAGDAWEQVCAQLNSQSFIFALASYGGRLYGGTYPNGLLFRLNEAGDAWEQVCDSLNSQTYIYDLSIYNARLYGGTLTGGRLFRLNASGDAWEQVCAQLNSQTNIHVLLVSNGYMYGGTGLGGRLFSYYTDPIVKINFGRSIYMGVRFEAIREIPDTFFSAGSDYDGKEGEMPYIDCTQMTSDANGRKGRCIGIHVDSVSDTEDLATVKVKLVGSNEISNFNLFVGGGHPYALSRIYGYTGNARGVKLLY